MQVKCHNLLAHDTFGNNKLQFMKPSSDTIAHNILCNAAANWHACKMKTKNFLSNVCYCVKKMSEK